MSDGAKRGIAVLLAIIELLLTPVALMWAGLSVMMFDAPGSEERTVLWIAFAAAWVMPVALVVGAGFAIAAAARFTRRRLLLALGIPGAALLASIVAIAAV